MLPWRANAVSRATVKSVGMAAFDLRSASLHLSQYIETSSSYQNTKTLLRLYDPSVIIVPPNKLIHMQQSTLPSSTITGNAGRPERLDPYWIVFIFKEVGMGF